MAMELAFIAAGFGVAVIGEPLLAAGDVLVSYDGKAIRNDAEFTIWVKTPGNSPRELVVLRGRLRLTFEVKPGLLGPQLRVRAVASPSLISGNSTNR
jgi:hypothetical protein